MGISGPGQVYSCYTPNIFLGFPTLGSPFWSRDENEPGRRKVRHQSLQTWTRWKLPYCRGLNHFQHYGPIFLVALLYLLPETCSKMTLPIVLRPTDYLCKPPVLAPNLEIPGGSKDAASGQWHIGVRGRPAAAARAAEVGSRPGLHRVGDGGPVHNLLPSPKGPQRPRTKKDPTFWL